MEENKEEKNCPCCSGKHKERQEKEKKGSDEPAEADRRTGARHREYAGEGCILYGCIDTGFCGHIRTQQLQ